MKFKIGDKVSYEGPFYLSRRGLVGVITAVRDDNSYPYDVTYDDYPNSPWLCVESELELAPVFQGAPQVVAVKRIAEGQPPAKVISNYFVQNSTAGTVIRQFESGATRNVDHNRIDPEAFIDPAVLLRYSEYMNRNRVQADGSVREGDNWQKGIPYDAYAKSLNRHHLDFWLRHRGHETHDSQVDNLCAIIFNSMGYLSELLKKEKTPHPREV